MIVWQDNSWRTAASAWRPARRRKAQKRQKLMKIWNVQMKHDDFRRKNIGMNETLQLYMVWQEIFDAFIRFAICSESSATTFPYVPVSVSVSFPFAATGYNASESLRPPRSPVRLPGASRFWRTATVPNGPMEINGSLIQGSPGSPGLPGSPASRFQISDHHIQ